MARRAKGEGSITQRPDGSWVAVVSKRDATGKRVRIAKYARSKAEAAQKLKEIQENEAAGVSTSNVGLVHFLKHDWLPKISPNLRPATVFTYSDLIERYIAPHVGAVSLGQFRPLGAEALLEALRKAGASARYQALVYTLLKSAYERAVRWRVVAHNPMNGVDKPKHKYKKFEVWTPEEAQKFMASVKETRMGPLFSLALTTGLRIGELLGLKWEDIDFLRREVHVRRQLTEERRYVDGVMKRFHVLADLKTDAGRRTFTLSRVCITALVRQKETMFREGRRSSEMVFLTESGTFYLQSNVGVAFKKAIKVAGVRDIRFHDMRHTNATILIASGTDIKTVSSRLGHASVNITLNTYAKFSKSADEKAATVMDSLEDKGT